MTGFEITHCSRCRKTRDMISMSAKVVISIHYVLIVERM